MAVSGRIRNDLPSFPHPEKVSTSPFDFNPSSSVFRMSAHNMDSSKQFPATISLAATVQGRKESLKDSRWTISNDPFAMFKLQA